METRKAMDTHSTRGTEPTAAFFESGFDEGFLVAGTGKPCGVSLPKTYGELRELAPLLREDAEEVAGSSACRTVRRWLDFGTLSLEVLTFGDDPSAYTLSSVEVSSARWSVTGPFRVGQRIEPALRRLGAVAMPGVTVTERFGDEGAQIQFMTSGGRITRIRVSCFAA